LQALLLMKARSVTGLFMRHSDYKRM
jgi:hypothetical protein